MKNIAELVEKVGRTLKFRLSDKTAEKSPIPEWL